MKAGSSADIGPAAAQCALLAATTLFHERVLSFGASRGVLPEGASNALTTGAGLGTDASDAVRSGMFKDGCAFVSTAGLWTSSLATPFVNTACRAVGGGVVTHGLHGVIAAVTASAVTACSVRAQADVSDDGSGLGLYHAAGSSSVYSAPAVLTSGAMKTMTNVTENYAAPGLQVRY
jgi:hypothetical protein